MSFESTRTSKLAIVEETVEGTPIAPSGGSEFINLQPDWEFAPEFASISNEEISGSIGVSKPILGLESPTVSGSHYLRANSEGVAPSYNLILKSLMGIETVNSTERTTDAGSTVSQVELAAGGTDFSRGFAVLLKDAANGYSVRNISSVATNSLLLAQNLADAPASGVTCGKNINYTPNDTGIPLSLWHYSADGGAVQMVSGAKVSEGTIDIVAAELINASYSFVAQKYYYDPIEITSSFISIDFDDGSGEENASIAAGMYTDPKELASAIQAAMNALTADNITVTYSDSTGKFTFTSDGSTFELLFSSGTNTATTIATKVGFTVADQTAALTYTSASAQDWSAPYTPVVESVDPLIAKHHEMILGDSDQISCFPASNISVSISKDPVNVLSICADSGKSASLFNVRAVAIEIQAYMSRHDVDKFDKYKNNTTIAWTYNAGKKTAGNWDAGSIVNLHTPKAVISSLTPIIDVDGIVGMNMTLTAFVDSGNPEFYINLL